MLRPINPGKPPVPIIHGTAQALGRSKSWREDRNVSTITEIEPRFLGRSTSSLHRLSNPFLWLRGASIGHVGPPPPPISSSVSLQPSPLTGSKLSYSPGNDGNRTNKLQIWKRAWPCRRLVTLLHFTVSPNCYYGNYFSSVGRVLLVMWHTAKAAAAQYRLVRI
jgi:hypothetical protein